MIQYIFLLIYSCKIHSAKYCAPNEKHDLLFYMTFYIIWRMISPTLADVCLMAHLRNSCRHRAQKSLSAVSVCCMRPAYMHTNTPFIETSYPNYINRSQLLILDGIHLNFWMRFESRGFRPIFICWAQSKKASGIIFILCLVWCTQPPA